ncbi:M13 family metallopeptidase [Sphingosinicella sp. CPCC 101087]|uniref:M13 family metallopeptidase n=1 Tax=Sphingosinicella sp. CPCC 101087 TaxID=2497754 RepID=UPI0013EAE152|nr:M13 family metallopeptidase [Sphingosinicella sp. CPCC 101087]
MTLRPFLIGLALLGTPPVMAQEAVPGPAPAQAPGKAAWGTFGVDFDGMDRSVHPGDDFWQYVNGRWAATVSIPADRGAQSQVARLNDLAASQVRAILDEMSARRAALSGDELRVVDYWTSLMDQDAIDRRGAAPLREELAPALAAADRAALAREMGRLVRGWRGTPPVGRMPRYFPAPIDIGITQDARQPERYVPALGQGGLGMPNRDYYLGDDEASLRTQTAYREHIATMLTLAGVPGNEAAARADAVHAFERAIAQLHWPLADSRDSEKTYNPRSQAELESEAPGFDWGAFFDGAGLAGRPTYIVGELSAVSGIARLWSETPLPVLKDWLTLHLAKDRAMVLPRAFSEAEFAFSGGVLGGATEAPARSMQAVELTGVALTDAVSKPYVERHFPPATKAAMDELVANVLAAMDRRLANLEWMQPETRERARAKLAAFTPMIGYPDRWRSYDGLEVVRGDAYGNFRRSAQWDHARRLARIDEPVDRGEWWMMPITPNAYASFANNQIVFPAAYLQPPHFDANADPAVNYGAIGYVIGHEISHHFDDQGSRRDPQGRMIPWWTEADMAAFRERTRRLVVQYDGYEALPGLNIRGAQTLGENIADNAGLAIAYDAYRLSLGGREAPVIDGFTGDQRFFMGRAQVNRVAFREEELRRAVLSGVHSPSRWRTWAVRNHDAWYRAFGVGPGHRLYLPPEERIRIW